MAPGVFPPRNDRASAASAKTEARLARWLGPLLLVATFCGLGWWSWGRWTDVQVDFGNELYIPWQLSQGSALYRDIAYRNGPLSQYLNTLWFLVFGVSIRTLVLCNLAILAGICAMTYRIFERGCDRPTATVVCLVLLCVFGFSQYVGIANYNYVTPYQHYQTHGLALSIAMITAFSAALRSRRAAWLAVAGACLGLTLLTKAELAVPALATAALGLLLLAGGVPCDGRRRARLALAFTAALLLPSAGFFALLAGQMPADAAASGLLGNWASTRSGVLEDFFYRRGAGLDDARGNLLLALRMLLGLIAFQALAAAADRWSRLRSWSAAVAATAVFAVGVAWPDLVPWPDLSRALPFTTLAAGAGLAWSCRRGRAERERVLRRAPLALWALYALGLLGKMILNARIYHYGFALAMPATLLLVAVPVHFAPTWLRRRFGTGALARALGIAAVGAGVVFFLRLSDEWYQKKGLTVGAGADAIRVEDRRFSPRGHVIATALRRLQERMPADATLLVLPEGIGINYWLRRANPTRYNLFLPAEIAGFGGEAVMLEDLRRHPPDFVLLLHRDFAEFGTGPFGAEPRSGRRILRWVARNYVRLERIGAEPFRSQRFGAEILRRKVPAAAAAGKTRP
jgi:hypothetical protein